MEENDDHGICLSVFQRIGLSWAPNVWRPESQRGGELLTLKKSFTGSTLRLPDLADWNYFCLQFDRWGVAPNPTLKNKACSEGRWHLRQGSIGRRVLGPLLSLPLPGQGAGARAPWKTQLRDMLPTEQVCEGVTASRLHPWILASVFGEESNFPSF